MQTQAETQMIVKVKYFSNEIEKLSRKKSW